jgi:hypothetical protein
MFPVALPRWGRAVAFDDDGILVSRPIQLADDHDEPLQPVNVVCEHLLNDVNEALGTRFPVDQFPFVSCEAHTDRRAVS